MWEIRVSPLSRRSLREIANRDATREPTFKLKNPDGVKFELDVIWYSRRHQWSEP
jgi:hypothetical protein